MQPIDQALVFEAIRYQAAYRAEARQNHHRSIPGPLVAELLRYIEGSMEGVTQSELELLLLSSRTARTTRLDGDNLGAQWRAYVAHRGRDVHEKKEWRNWYGKYGKKEAIRQLAVTDPFLIQEPPLPPLDSDEDQSAAELPARPQMRGLPQDGRPMNFHKMRDILARWTAALMQRAIEQVACLPDEEQPPALVRSLQRVQMRLHPIVGMVNAWEAANELLSNGILLDTPNDLPADFSAALDGVEARETHKQQELVAYWEKRLPALMSRIP
ncbi:hypothetical protein [Aquabacterium parvum]|uniref:hypothetical protein n=1 Tax=Aquabacterium parvum TaxID=70584 RepID=UPI000718B248|nr:hypothetical protein [Aquabacterium parvum]MBU0915577.1 hypothetical protein [Gammaproteobacteria bacterium]